MKIIIDTNIFYSAIGFDNTIYDFLIDALNSYECKIYCSNEIMFELKNKLFGSKFDQKTKNKLTTTQKDEFINLLKNNLIFVEPTNKVNICRDSDDNKFLELAVTIDVNYIITGDQDLLELQFYQNTKILKPSQFIALNLL